MTNETTLAAKMRPLILDDVVGQSHLIGQGQMLRRMIEADMLMSIILYGPPGTGKTTLARVIAHTTKSNFKQINATTAGKADMKTVIDEAQKLKDDEDKKTTLFIDEIHRFNKAQQDFLLPFVESGLITLIGATTENPFFEVNKALLSRSTIFELYPIEDEDIIKLVNRACTNPNGYGNADFTVNLTENGQNMLARFAGGDARKALNALELAVKTTPPDNNIITIDENVIANCIQHNTLHYDKDGDDHYDLISAFIESVKHSEPDAALYYLARILKSGEMPEYVARRLAVIATEDIGMADPNALHVATDTITICHFIGMPEAAKTLALAAVYMSSAPKSDSVIKAYTKASELVDQTGNIPVPMFLRDCSYKSAGRINHGVGLLDIHAYPYHYKYQDCMPTELGRQKFWQPETLGYEKIAKDYMNWCEQNH